MLILLSFGLSTAVAWGLADIFIAQATRRIKPLLAAALVNCIGAGMFGLYYWFFARDSVYADIAALVLSAGAGILLAMASAFFFVALHKGPVGIVSAISGTYPAVTLLMAVTLFDAAISIQQGIGIAIVLAGVIMATGSFSGSHLRSGYSVQGPLIALLPSVCWGVGYSMLAEAVKLLDWQTASIFQFGAMTVFYIVVMLIMMQRKTIDAAMVLSGVQNPSILAAAFTQQAGALLFNIGLGFDNDTGGSVIVALSACYPILTMVLAFFYLKERLPFIAIAGGILAIVGILMLSS